MKRKNRKGLLPMRDDEPKTKLSLLGPEGTIPVSPSTIASDSLTVPRPNQPDQLLGPRMVPNPLRLLPRKSLCPCRSGKKFKLCCLIKLPAMVPVALAEQFREQMTKPDLVFLTPDNAEEVREAVEALRTEDRH